MIMIYILLDCQYFTFYTWIIFMVLYSVGKFWSILMYNQSRNTVSGDSDARWVPTFGWYCVFILYLSCLLLSLIYKACCKTFIVVVSECLSCLCLHVAVTNMCPCQICIYICISCILNCLVRENNELMQVSLFFYQTNKHVRMLKFRNPGKFMEDFDPERSRREMRKMNRRIYRDSWVIMVISRVKAIIRLSINSLFIVAARFDQRHLIGQFANTVILG